MEQTKNDSNHHNQNQNPIPSSKRLGVIFDIDGTFIAEHPNTDFSRRIILRPDTIQFLSWLKNRGHSIALWTKGHITHADNVKDFICKQVAAANFETNQETFDFDFDFVWGGERMRRRSIPSHRYQTMSSFSSLGTECKWCEAYSSRCQQCTCYINYRCPCMGVKDLRYAWNPKRNKNRNKDRTGTATKTDAKIADLFRKENTLIVENTPQNCIYNYGNAIYVPTFSGMKNDDVFQRLQKYIMDALEKCDDVRTVSKCSHGQGYHACYEQSWLTDENYSNNNNAYTNLE